MPANFCFLCEQFSLALTLARASIKSSSPYCCCLFRPYLYYMYTSLFLACSPSFWLSNPSSPVSSKSVLNLSFHWGLSLKFQFGGIFPVSDSHYTNFSIQILCLYMCTDYKVLFFTLLFEFSPFQNDDTICFIAWCENKRNSFEVTF